MRSRVRAAHVGEESEWVGDGVQRSRVEEPGPGRVNASEWMNGARASEETVSYVHTPRVAAGFRVLQPRSVLSRFVLLSGEYDREIPSSSFVSTVFFFFFRRGGGFFATALEFIAVTKLRLVGLLLATSSRMICGVIRFIIVTSFILFLFFVNLRSSVCFCDENFSSKSSNTWKVTWEKVYKVLLIINHVDHPFVSTSKRIFKISAANEEKIKDARGWNFSLPASLSITRPTKQLYLLRSRKSSSGKNWFQGDLSTHLRWLFHREILERKLRSASDRVYNS